MRAEEGLRNVIDEPLLRIRAIRIVELIAEKLRLIKIFET